MGLAVPATRTQEDTGRVGRVLAGRTPPALHRLVVVGAAATGLIIPAFWEAEQRERHLRSPKDKNFRRGSQDSVLKALNTELRTSVIPFSTLARLNPILAVSTCNLAVTALDCKHDDCQSSLPAHFGTILSPITSFCIEIFRLLGRIENMQI